MASVAMLRPQPVPLYQHIPNDKLMDIPIKIREKQSQPVSNMSSAAPIQQEVHKGVKLTRKSHNKVRTGCLTCKIRKKKCDETKPACTRCTSTGRKCDGYAVAETPSTTGSPGAERSPLPMPHTSKLVHTSQKQISTELRVVELHDDGDSVDDQLKANDNIDEAEVTDFILSYATKTSSEVLTPASNSFSSVLTTRSHSPQSMSSPNTQYSFHTSTLSRSPNLFPQSSQISPIEASCFSYFKHVTGPSFASYFDSSLWRSYAINAALAHPAVFSAATALGAVHQRFNFGISREAFEYCGHAARFFAKALHQLEELKNQHVNHGLLGSSSSGGKGMGIYDRDVIMTCEALLGLFEGFQQNYAEAVAHVSTGMKYMLARPMTLMHSETQHCAVEFNTNVFRQLFDRVKLRALQLFGTDIRILVSWGKDQDLPTIPDVFSNLDEARDFIFTEVDWIMHAPEETWSNEQGRSEAQALHVERLMKWSVSYAETVKLIDRTPRQKAACKLMKFTRNAMHLLFMTLFAKVDFKLSMVPSIHRGTEDDASTREDYGDFLHATQGLYEMVKHGDYLTTHLARLKILSESILDDSSVFQYDEHSVSFDSALGPPRRPERHPDSSNKTRHLVKTFLRNSPKSSALWEMLGVYGVAEKVSAVEEHAVIEAIKDIIPEHINPRWVDITCLMESRKILLRYCRPDDYGLGMVWTQEWWAF